LLIAINYSSVRVQMSLIMHALYFDYDSCVIALLLQIYKNTVQPSVHWLSR